MTLIQPAPVVHVVAVVGGGDSILLSHFITHYRSLGVESFFIIRHAESTEDPDYELIEHYAREAGVELHRTHLGPWDDEMHGRLMTEAMLEHPEDWYILADLDEFLVFDRPLADLIELAESGGYTHVCGCYIDRIAADGELPEVTAEPLWDQFPLGGALTSQLLSTLPLKRGLARGWTQIGGGHHGTPGRTGVPRTSSYIQVHHFKWTGTLVARMRRRIERYEQGVWQLRYPGVLDDARRLLDRLDEHGGRIDVTDNRLLLDKCGPAYTDFTPWPLVVEDAQRWAYVFPDE